MVMLAPFLKYVAEGKVIRRYSDLQRFTFPEVTQRIFVSLLALTVLSSQNKEFTKAYVEQTLGYGTFDKVRMSQNDLYNMLAIVSGDPEITKKLKNKNQAQAMRQRQPVPVMALRRFLRTFEDKYKFLSTLERSMNIRDANLRNLKRRVADFDNLDSTNKKLTKLKLVNLLNILLPNTDIQRKFKEINA